MGLSAGRLRGLASLSSNNRVTTQLTLAKVRNALVSVGGSLVGTGFVSKPALNLRKGEQLQWGNIPIGSRLVPLAFPVRRFIISPDI